MVILETKKVYTVCQDRLKNATTVSLVETYSSPDFNVAVKFQKDERGVNTNIVMKYNDNAGPHYLAYENLIPN